MVDDQIIATATAGGHGAITRIGVGKTPPGKTTAQPGGTDTRLWTEPTSLAGEVGGAGTLARTHADVAQLVEHFTRNEGVPGSSPGVGFIALGRGFSKFWFAV